MANRGKPNKIELHYILTHPDSAKKKARYLKFTEAYVQKLIDQNSKGVVPAIENVIREPEPQPEATKAPSAFDFMIKQATGGRKGIMVGTQTVSQRADESSTVNKDSRSNMQNTYKVHNRPKD